MTTKANRPSRKAERAEIAQEISDIMDHGQHFASEGEFNRATSAADLDVRCTGRNFWSKRSLIDLRPLDREKVRTMIWKLTGSKLLGAFIAPAIEELIV